MFLLLPEARRTWLLPHLISFATGALLAAALIGLLPEAIASVGSARASRPSAPRVLAGIALFFVLEKLVLWRHCHHGESCETPFAARDRIAIEPPAGSCCSATAAQCLRRRADRGRLPDRRASWAWSRRSAITAHEIPQELGDLAVLLHARMSPARALWFNAASSLTSILGGLLGYFALAAHARRAALCHLGGGGLADLCRRSRT